MTFTKDDLAKNLEIAVNATVSGNKDDALKAVAVTHMRYGAGDAGFNPSPDEVDRHLEIYSDAIKQLIGGHLGEIADSVKRNPGSNFTQLEAKAMAFGIVSKTINEFYLRKLRI